MMRTICLLLLLAIPSSAAIVAKGSSIGCATPDTTTKGCSASPVAIAAGDTIVAVGFKGPQTGVLSLMTDSCGHHWESAVQASPVPSLEVFVTLNSPTTNASCTITVTRSDDSNGLAAFVAQIYTGVASYEANSTGNGTGFNAGPPAFCGSPNVQTTVDDLAIGAFQFLAATGAGVIFQNYVGTFTSTFRGTVNMTAAQTYHLTLFDRVGTGTSATVQAGVTYTTQPTVCNRLAITLRAATANAGRTALSTDAMQSVLISSDPARNYLLPANALSPRSDWCTWVMPTGPVSNSYSIAPQSIELNGQTGDMVVPGWQMTRVCQDGTRNYWANPPFKPGTNVTFNATPTGITINATGGGGLGNIPPQNFVGNPTNSTGPAQAFFPTGDIHFDTTTVGALRVNSLHFIPDSIVLGTKPTAGQYLMYNGMEIIGGTPSPVGGAVNKIAGGTFTLPSTAVTANTCVTVTNMTNSAFPGLGVNNVQQTDVVTFSTETTVGGWGNGHIQIRAEPYAGSIGWRECNGSTTNFTGEAIPVNFMVVR